MNRNIIVAVTGASGAPYARRLIQLLADARLHVHVVFSPFGKRLFADELSIHTVTVQSIVGRPCEWITLHAYHDVGSVIASGSYKTEGMVICPCSANTFGAVASGLGDNLIHRAAQVTLKEARRLVLVYREMPMSQIDLKNALTLSQAGAIVCPANPGFYMMPQNVDDIVDFVVGKILDLLNVEHDLNTRWEQQRSTANAATGEPTTTAKP